MFSKITKRLRYLLSESASRWVADSVACDQMRINQGLLLASLNQSKQSTNIQDFEFKIFSQWGEDGIIQKLIQSIEIKNKTFIEFGVETFAEANCRFLMMKDNWAGHVIDGSKENINKIRTSHYFWKYQLTARAAFITAENVNELLAESGFDRDIGILSIDIDGVDYWLLKALNYYKPRILILEYNAVFGGQRKISVPYDALFNRTTKHSSNLYFGASLAAMTELAVELGYRFVGTTSSGVNAFYVRGDLLCDVLEPIAATAHFTMSKTREARDNVGALNFVAGEDRLALICGMPVINTETGKSEKL